MTIRHTCAQKRMQIAMYVLSAQLVFLYVYKAYVMVYVYVCKLIFLCADVILCMLRTGMLLC